MKKPTLLLAHLLTRHACLWAALGLLATLAFGPPPAQAAVSEAWVHRYSNVVSNSDGNSYGAIKVVRDAADDIIVTGNIGSEMLTIKYSGVDGSVLWQKRYSGPQNFDDQVARAVAVDGMGNVVVTGYSYNGSLVPDGYTAKYAAADGALLWEQRGPEGGLAVAVAVDGSGNVVVTGTSSADYYMVKHAAADGALLWEKRYNGPANRDDRAQALALDGSGNVVVTGLSDGGASDYDYYTAKYAAANGALLWEKRYNGTANSYDYVWGVVVDGSGNVVVTGTSGTIKYLADGTGAWTNNGGATALTVDGSGNVVVTAYSNNNGNADSYTAKYAASDGALLWEKRYNGAANSADFAWAVAVDGSGNVVVTGDSVTIKYLADGTGAWTNNGGATALTVDGSGNVVVTGTSYNTNGNVKYAARDGALLWAKRYDGPWNDDHAQAVAVDGSGNVVVTGYSMGGGSGYDYYTAKYAAADGALLWEKRCNGPANSDDRAQALAVDGSGNVVVTGSSVGGGGGYDYYTAKYAAADGVFLWEKRGPRGGATAVVVAGSGDVVVTGSSVGSTGFPDYYTAKYAAANGALLWEQRYNGPATDYDYDGASAVAVDGSGNVVVTGHSRNSGGDNDYYTAKYAAANGALLWEKRGPGGFAYAVAVDGSGNVVVTGESAYDYYTGKYAAANGALLWEKRYDGPTNGYDQANAVAVDSSGNVVVTGAFTTGWDDNEDPIYGSYTAKYAAADGALLWEKHSTNGSASAVAVDGSGNVVVKGYSRNSSVNTHNYTVKYAAADGALLWEQYYGLIVGGSHSLALGPNGVVAVTGSSSGDYATVVYRDDVYPISIALVSTEVRLRFVGIPGRSYTIERAPAVTGPWATINTQTTPASGLTEYLNTKPPIGSAFYRTVQP